MLGRKIVTLFSGLLVCLLAPRATFATLYASINVVGFQVTFSPGFAVPDGHGGTTNFVLQQTPETLGDQYQYSDTVTDPSTGASASVSINMHFTYSGPAVGYVQALGGPPPIQVSLSQSNPNGANLNPAGLYITTSYGITASQQNLTFDDVINATASGTVGPGITDYNLEEISISNQTQLDYGGFADASYGDTSPGHSYADVPLTDEEFGGPASETYSDPAKSTINLAVFDPGGTGTTAFNGSSSGVTLVPEPVAPALISVLALRLARRPRNRKTGQTGKGNRTGKGEQEKGTSLNHYE